MHNDTENWVENIESMMRAHFGDVVKAYWVYGADLCPCCGVRPIDATVYKGQQGLSINGFMYREKGVLIAYLLCNICANAIHACAGKYERTPMHADIEKTLEEAYNRYLASQDA